MALSLRIPRVEVFWGETNLTFYQGKGESDPLYGQPLVYNVSVSLSENSQNPSGSMNWNPTGAAYAVYENLVKNFADRIITTRFYYIDGRSITFAFVWTGHQENYGNSMEIRVSLSSELDGLTNGIIRSTAQADEQGTSFTTTLKELEKFYGVESYNLVDYTEKAKKDLEKAKVQSNYQNGTKFYDAISSLVQDNGNMVFPSNIVTTKDTSQPAAKCIIFTPYAWDKDIAIEELSPTEQFPSPKKRYGYFLGPCLIDTITKQSQWQPPQKSQVITVNGTQKLQPAPSENPAPGSTNGSTTVSPATPTGTPTNIVPTGGVAAARRNAKAQPGATGSSRSASRSQSRLVDNQDGEEKKLLMEKQHQCKLSTTLFMAPVFTGLKPHDVLFIPNFSGSYMEDWVVTAVEYTQTDGGATLSVQATRHFGLAEYMNPTQGKVWLEKAISLGLVGDNGTLENWMNYGWKPGTVPASPTNGSTSLSGGTSSPASSNPNPVTPQGAQRLQVVPYSG